MEQVTQHVINCDTAPPIPHAGWSVEEHKKSGQLQFDPTKIELYLHKKQQDNYIVGNDLRTELTNKPVLNANVLDHLLKNQHLIPETWKGKYIFFWGTIYRDRDGYRCVRYLSRDGVRWYWRYNWLVGRWDSRSPAAVSAI